MADHDGAEPVLVDRTREKRLDALRAGVSGEIPVGRLSAKQSVAQRPTDYVRGLASVEESVKDLGDRGRDMGRRRGFTG
jgi:hypothetical protein